MAYPSGRAALDPRRARRPVRSSACPAIGNSLRSCANWERSQNANKAIIPAFVLVGLGLCRLLGRDVFARNDGDLDGRVRGCLGQRFERRLSQRPIESELRFVIL